MLTVYTAAHGVLESHKDEAAVVTVGFALSNANIVLPWQNIKSSLLVAAATLIRLMRVSTCVQLMVQLFMEAKHIYQIDVLRLLFFYMAIYKDVILIESKKNVMENRSPFKPEPMSSASHTEFFRP